MSIDLDDIDRQLLLLVAQNARHSVRELARRVSMSPGAVAERVSRLEACGVIRGYHAAIDPAALGYGLEAIVTLQTEQGPAVEETLDRLLAIPEVEGVSVVTGRWDLIVRVRVKDHHHLRDVVLREIWRIPAFRHSETMITYETRQRPGGWNVALALEQAPSAESP